MKAIRAKFEQHVDLQEKRLETYPEKLVEDAPNDAYWGRGREISTVGHLSDGTARPVSTEKGHKELDSSRRGTGMEKTFHVSSSFWFSCNYKSNFFPECFAFLY